MIYKFKPIYKPTLWGGRRIADFKGLATDGSPVGESWEISAVPGDVSTVCGGADDGLTIDELVARDGASLLGKANHERFGGQFPLLVKFIDARLDLSIQVHPNDALARERHGVQGKSEMWYIIDAEPGARIKPGLKAPLDEATFVKAVEEHTICECLADYEVRAGDVFYLPSGRIHSIGAGCFISEIQQTSDITYRIYDYNRVGTDGRPRELHTELSKDAVDYTVLEDYRTHYKAVGGALTPLVASPHFNVELAVLTDSPVALPELDSFKVVVAVEGSVRITASDGTEQTLHAGETALIPANEAKASIAAASASSKALVSYIV